MNRTRDVRELSNEELQAIIANDADKLLALAREREAKQSQAEPQQPEELH